MKSILTPFQKSIFEAICQEKLITDNFYFGGGTALSEFYLKHRYSEDFDFFTENEIPFEEIRVRLDNLVKKLGIKSVEYREVQSLKIFFFPFYHFGEANNYKGLKIMSMLDIAISKLDTILTRKKARDFVDFYFIQKKYQFELEYLLKKIEEKFRWEVDSLFLAGCFLKAEELRDYPRMIKKFSREKMVSFFLDLAKAQKDKIVFCSG